MKKFDPTTLAADWSVVTSRPRAWSGSTERPPWEYVTSMELSSVLSKPHQVLANWSIRNVLPPPTTNNPHLRGNKRYYRIATIRAWLEGRSEFDIIKDWIKHDIQADDLTDGQVHNLLSTLYKVSEKLS